MSERDLVEWFKHNYAKLGFSEIKDLQTKFPDCTAIKDRKQVTIEFELISWGLTEHLLKAQYNAIEFKLVETAGAYIVVYSPLNYEHLQWEDLKPEYRMFEPLKYLDCFVFAYYPKLKFIIKLLSSGFEFYYKKLPVDYCICCEDKYLNKNLEAYRDVKIIEVGYHIEENQ